MGNLFLLKHKKRNCWNLQTQNGQSSAIVENRFNVYFWLFPLNGNMQVAR